MKPSDSVSNWPELLEQPRGGDHLVQLYQDEAFLCEAVSEHAGLAPAQAIKRRQLVILDAGETLGKFTPGGMPDWLTFHALVDGVIAELRLSHPNVRAYGEMVDVLWQRGERDAAIRLEEFWNDLAKLQTFSLLCAYYMDNLGPDAYAGPLECLCRVHTHLIPARDYGALDRAVLDASRQVLDQPLAQILLSVAADGRPATQMPDGQATLLWLKRNMPRTADKVLAEVRARCSG